MVIDSDCPGCGKNYRLDGGLAGKKVKCKGCGHVFHVPVPRSLTAAARPSRLDLLLDEEDAAPVPLRKAPVRPVDDESFSPPRAKVKKTRKKPVESPISNRTVSSLIGLFFGFNGLVFLGVIIAGIAGLLSSVQAGMIFAMCFMLACLAMIAIGFIGLAVVAFGEDAVQGLLCLFIPFYWIYYTATRWQAAKGMFAIGMTGLGCYIVPLILVLSLASMLGGRSSRPGSFIARGGGAPPGFVEQVDRQAAAIRGRYGDRTVTILVAGLPRERRPGRGDHHRRRHDRHRRSGQGTRPRLQASLGTGIDDRFALVVAPVDDPAGLAGRIDFGKATCKGQIIEVIVSADFVASVSPGRKPPRPPSPRTPDRPTMSQDSEDADPTTSPAFQLQSADKGRRSRAWPPRTGSGRTTTASPRSRGDPPDPGR